VRLARPDDLTAIVALTAEAYAPYTPIFGGPPVPVTEDYTPRIERGEVWLLEEDTKLAGLIVLERHSDHAMIFSVAVAPAFQGRKLGIKLLDFAEEQARSWACRRCGSTPIRAWSGTSRSMRPMAIAKRVAGPTRTGQDGRWSTWRSRSIKQPDRISKRRRRR
jgi:GNAT superfamily N-acetyltransferase